VDVSVGKGVGVRVGGGVSVGAVVAVLVEVAVMVGAIVLVGTGGTALLHAVKIKHSKRVKVFLDMQLIIA
jgi:hypothetical protein